MRSDAIPGRLALGMALLTAALLSTGACSIFSPLLGPSGPAPRPFDHKAHLDRGVDCATCHEGAATSAMAGMPTKELCATCHDELDADPKKPLAKKASWYFDEAGKPSWSSFTRAGGDVIFSHAKHKDACTACHEGIDRNTGLIAEGMVQPMDSCVACHERSAPEKNGCRVCHATLDRGTAPASHARMWMRRHGECARAGPHGPTADRCSMCHRTETCTLCHQTTAPFDHHGDWRNVPHGVAASMDRSRCRTCHGSDMCVRCHQETAPRSHAAGWDAPRNNHCYGCHQPLSKSGGCAVCHRSTPGHDAVPPWPAWHTPTLNCRSCHAASLGHPDNGDSCTSCHR